MKNSFSLFVAIIISCASSYAQAPNKMSYQAVVRDASNNLITNQSIGVKVEINEGTTIEYSERHVVTTNANGLFSIIIGNGTLISGLWSNLDWDSNVMSIDTEIDLTGGTNYTISASNILNSVPYAFHAQTAASYTETDPLFSSSPAGGITGVNISDWNNKQDQLTAGSGISINGNTISANSTTSQPNFYLGQDTLGGIVYFIYEDSSGTQHGSIVYKNDTTLQYQTGFSVIGASSSWDGVANLSIMSTTSNPIGGWAFSLNPPGTGITWYIPSIDELIILLNQRYIVNKSGSGLAISANETYWSSTEANQGQAFVIDYANSVRKNQKTNNYKSLLIRKF